MRTNTDFNKRNTSAYAEKTPIVFLFFEFEKKHLRVRGENLDHAFAWVPNEETPPRTRRKQVSIGRAGGIIGNTSAYAEKTTSHKRLR